MFLASNARPALPDPEDREDCVKLRLMGFIDVDMPVSKRFKLFSVKGNGEFGNSECSLVVAGLFFLKRASIEKSFNELFRFWVRNGETSNILFVSIRSNGT